MNGRNGSPFPEAQSPKDLVCWEQSWGVYCLVIITQGLNCSNSHPDSAIHDLLSPDHTPSPCWPYEWVMETLNPSLLEKSHPFTCQAIRETSVKCSTCGVCAIWERSVLISYRVFPMGFSPEPWKMACTHTHTHTHTLGITVLLNKRSLLKSLFLQGIYRQFKTMKTFDALI